MPSRTYSDYNQDNPITATWLNGVNQFVYGTAGNNAKTSPAAWVRFDGTTGTMVQSYGVSQVVRNSVGNYTITFANPLPQVSNCYSIMTNVLGMNAVTAETTTTVTIETANSGGVLTDPPSVSFIMFGAYTPNF